MSFDVFCVANSRNASRAKTAKLRLKKETFFRLSPLSFILNRFCQSDHTNCCYQNNHTANCKYDLSENGVHKCVIPFDVDAIQNRDIRKHHHHHHIILTSGLERTEPTEKRSSSFLFGKITGMLGVTISQKRAITECFP